MKAQITVQNDLGKFSGEIFEIANEKYESLVEKLKTYYEQGFEMNLDGGGLMIFPPDIIKKSILKINKLDV